MKKKKRGKHEDNREVRENRCVFRTRRSRYILYCKENEEEDSFLSVSRQSFFLCDPLVKIRFRRRTKNKRREQQDKREEKPEKENKMLLLSFFDLSLPVKFFELQDEQESLVPPSMLPVSSSPPSLFGCSGRKKMEQQVDRFEGSFLFSLSSLFHSFVPLAEYFFYIYM